MFYCDICSCRQSARFLCFRAVFDPARSVLLEVFTLSLSAAFSMFSALESATLYIFSARLGFLYDCVSLIRLLISVGGVSVSLYSIILFCVFSLWFHWRYFCMLYIAGHIWIGDRSICGFDILYFYFFFV